MKNTLYLILSLFLFFSFESFAQQKKVVKKKAVRAAPKKAPVVTTNPPPVETPPSPPAVVPVEDLSSELEVPPPKRRKKIPSMVKSESQINREKAALKPKSKFFTQLGVGLLVWIEDVPAEREDVKTDMISMFQGVSLNYNRNRFVGETRWREVEGYELAGGIAKGKGTAVSIQDEVKNQMWFSFGYNRGWVYRTSPVSEIGFYFPGVIRLTQWKLEESDLKMQKQIAASVGVGSEFLFRINSKSSMRLSVTHQALWATTIWGAGYTRVF